MAVRKMKKMEMTSKETFRPLFAGTAIVALQENIFMKGKIWIAAGIALIGAAIYYFRRTPAVQNNLPEKENERHHLTNVFSKAKEVAIGN